MLVPLGFRGWCTQGGPGKVDSWQNVEPLTVLLEERQYLMDTAYEILGSRLAADDAVHETYAGWYAMRGCDIWSPRVWLRNKLVCLCHSLVGLSDRAPLDDVLGDSRGIEPLSRPVPGWHIDVAPGEA